MKIHPFISIYKYWLLPILLVATACDPFGTSLKHQVIRSRAQNISTTSFSDTLKVMTWNIKFGGGRIDFFFDCYGDRVIMNASEVNSNMNLLTQKIKQLDPDILFIQEVDINAKRSAHINQMQYILDHTQLNYGVYASQWKAKYIPKKGLGQMDSGNAILSKWEIKDPRRIPLPLIKEQNFIVRYFYLKRNLLQAEIDHPAGKLFLLNTHASAYARDNTKKRQLGIIKKHIDSLQKQGNSFILAGDFNSLPPYSKQMNNFDDNACQGGEYDANNYEEEAQWMMPFYDKYQSAIPLLQYKSNNQPFFTHTTDKNGFWNRKLDYIFTSTNLKPEQGKTHQEWMQTSDHAPITTSITFK